MALFSFGNIKLPKTTMIFNITPANLCPSEAKGLCQLSNSGQCYAKKAERIYPQVLPYRMRQHIFWKNCTPESFVAQLIKDKGRRNIKHLRLNEAGDFRHQQDLNKAIKIAALLKAEGITTYCYTARKDLDFKKRNDLIVNGSGFMIDNNFIVVPRGKKATCVSNCNICHRCMKANKKKITVAMH